MTKGICGVFTRPTHCRLVQSAGVLKSRMSMVRNALSPP
jgi:hypothetical protein